ncbi:MAG: nicotinate phosphoribosyltransferase [Planctomycetes bacterium]|nr:nicotinate phosphoribosyltransferase [Planctomycetota bacterium]
MIRPGEGVTLSVFDPAAERRDALRTDLYQVTMMAAMHVAGVDHEATFELTTRRLAPRRGYWVACGLELALEYLEGLRFDPAQVAWLRAHPAFKAVPDDFFAMLADFRFTGEVWAPAEGTPVFPQEPLLRVTAPAIQAQLVETYLLSLVNFQTLVASKAARVRRACRGKAFIDFGTRRAHGPEAGELVARACYLAGAKGTSNVEAGLRLGVPVFGTFAHSWVMMWDDEGEAFRRYAQAFPDATTLLIDTYDTVAAARRIVAEGLPCRAVRIDSGDLGALAREVRRVFDEGGRGEVQIVLSGDLNEEKVDALERAGGAADVYGVGTELAVSKDLPSLGGVYKVVETRHGDQVRHPVKLSADKQTWPGKKQVWRRVEGGVARGDVIALADEAAPGPGHEPLLERVMLGGRRARPAPALADLRARCLARVDALPPEVLAIEDPGPYPVRMSPGLLALAEEARAAVRARLEEGR